MISAIAQAKVRARAVAQMTTQITVKRGDYGPLNPTTGIVGGLSNTVTIYAGIARVHSLTGQGAVVAGDGEFDTRQVIVSIPADAVPVPARDDLVIIGANSGDPELPGTAYRVMEVDGGGAFSAVRQLSCVGWHPNRFWGEQ